VVHIDETGAAVKHEEMSLRLSRGQHELFDTGLTSRKRREKTKFESDR
jgi:hypothetical protein